MVFTRQTEVRATETRPVPIITDRIVATRATAAIANSANPPAGRRGAPGAGSPLSATDENMVRTTTTASKTTASAHPTTRSSLHNLPARMKRPLEIIDSNQDPLLPAKRARITVEILARPRGKQEQNAVAAAPASQKSITVKSQKFSSSTKPPPAPSIDKIRPPLGRPASPPAPPRHLPTPPPPPPQALPSKHAPTKFRQTTLTASQPPKTSKAAPNAQKTATKSQNKVLNGIRHELDRLQPSASDANSAKEPSGRKLRSQEATRFKSELSAYFPDYDEVIGNDPKEQHFLNVDTPIAVVDSRPPQTHTSLHTAQYPIRDYGDLYFTDLFDAQRINLNLLDANHNGTLHSEDPLPDSHFEPAHKKAERLEKSIRNTEKGRAQHEKDQIIRLLNELQGHDWLRTMGVNGVTESKKKTFEPARDHFVKGCQAILEKFRLWSQEEKRRKLEKEKALAEAAAAEDENEDEDEEEEEEEVEDSEAEEEGDTEMIDIEEGSADGEEENGGDTSSLEEAPDYSDVDASIARQLYHEAASAQAKYKQTGLGKRRRAEQSPELEPYVEREFTSFFPKRHLRDAALSKGRRRGRSAAAWGHAVPEPAEEDFDLPEEFRDEETLKVHARRKRRDRRGHRQ